MQKYVKIWTQFAKQNMQSYALKYAQSAEVDISHISYICALPTLLMAVTECVRRRHRQTGAVQ